MSGFVDIMPTYSQRTFGDDYEEEEDVRRGGRRGLIIGWCWFITTLVFPLPSDLDATSTN